MSGRWAHRGIAKHTSPIAWFLAFYWFLESLGLVAIKICSSKYGCKLTFFFIYYTNILPFFIPPRRQREFCIQTVVEKFHISKNNFITKFKSLPAFNINLLAFHLYRLSMLLEFSSIPATDTYPPTPISGIPHCHPVHRTAIPRHVQISFEPVSRQIKHTNIQLYNIWSFELQLH